MARAKHTQARALASDFFMLRAPAASSKNMTFCFVLDSGDLPRLQWPAV